MRPLLMLLAACGDESDDTGGSAEDPVDPCAAVDCRSTGLNMEVIGPDGAYVEPDTMVVALGEEGEPYDQTCPDGLCWLWLDPRDGCTIEVTLGDERRKQTCADDASISEWEADECCPDGAIGSLRFEF